ALVGGAALAFIKESMNNRVRTPDDVARWTAMPSLPMIPEIPLANGLGPRLRLYRGGKNSSRNGNGAEAIARLPRLLSADALTPEADAINNLRTSILISRGDSGKRVLLVVGTSPRTGSTTIAANLAMALAKRGKTCLVDANLRRPMVSRAFALAPAVGLCEVLRGDASLEEALAVAPRTSGLSLLLGGRIPVNPLDLLTGETMREVMRVLRERFEFVVVDSPPAIPFPDCRFLASISDGVVLVSRSGKTSRRTLVRSAEIIDEVQAPLLGVVVNGVDVDSADYRYFTCSNGKDAYPKNGKRYHPSIAVAAGNGFKAKPNAL
ncbi:MAG: polysaccharide biosynthesis tyrosine autokinase, partial [Candidatus Acidiferrales bacterium]